ncbi:MAG: SMC-Scp complex subunit ScpB [Chloroflexota bacterium]
MSEQDDEALISAIESILFVAGGPVKVAVLAAATNASPARVDAALARLSVRPSHGIRLQRHDRSAQLVTDPANVEAVQRFLGTAKPPPLSRATLETLTVVAYRQPVTRAEIEALRGANSDRAVQTLLARDLIEERGNRPTLGRPTEYGTSAGFLHYFGLSSLDDLPALEQEEEAGAAPPIFGFRSDRRKQDAAQSDD